MSHCDCLRCRESNAARETAKRWFLACRIADLKTCPPAVIGDTQQAIRCVLVELTPGAA